MRIITDTSAVLAVVSDEPAKPDIIQKTRGATLFAPESLHWEIGNALAAMLKRGRVDLAQAGEAVRRYQRIPIHLVEVDLARALAIARAHNLYAYDAYVITCALDRRMPLISVDRGLIHAANAAGVSVIKVSP
jgi:predicted nucleic acid-binding protein